MASFGSALTFVLGAIGREVCVNHLNNPVVVTGGHLVGSPLIVPCRKQRDGSGDLDVWETFSDTDWTATGWVQSDGSDIPTPPDGSFGWAFDAMRATPGEEYRPAAAKPGFAYFYSDALGFRLRLPNGVAVRPAFPAREMRGAWTSVAARPDAG